MQLSRLPVGPKRRRHQFVSYVVGLPTIYSVLCLSTLNAEGERESQPGLWMNEWVGGWMNEWRMFVDIYILNFVPFSGAWMAPHSLLSPYQVCLPACLAIRLDELSQSMYPATSVARMLMLQASSREKLSWAEQSMSIVDEGRREWSRGSGGYT